MEKFIEQKQEELLRLAKTEDSLYLSEVYTTFLADTINEAIKLSESGGSVSCEAHRPIEELMKEFIDLLIQEVNAFERMKSADTICNWVKEKLLSVR